MNRIELVRTVCRYVLAMFREQRIREMKTRLETLLDLLDMIEARDCEYMIKDIVETVCFVGEEETHASDL